MNYLNPPIFRICPAFAKILSAAAAAGIAFTAVHAQTAPTPSVPPDQPSAAGSAVQAIPLSQDQTAQPEVQQLEPFVVNTTPDTGYAAVNTLSGTRLDSSLRDVPDAMAVITPDMLQDLATTNPVEALLYTPSVDSYDTGDNTSPSRYSGNAIMYGNGQSFAIRGYNTNTGTQSFSADFFTYLAPSDNYNIERATLSRGPNEMLFGVGNTQGGTDLTIKHALPDKTKPTLSVTYLTDRWGSVRATEDLNVPIIEHKLAVRVNNLDDNMYDFREVGGNTDRRWEAGLTAKPFDKTMIMVDYEDYTTSQNIDPMTTEFDDGVLNWLANGKPTINFLNPGTTWAAGKAYPNASGQSIVYTPNPGITQITAQQPTFITGLNLADPVVNERYQGQAATEPTFGGQTEQYFQGINPFALYGISPDAYLGSGTRDDPGRTEDGHWTHVLVDQTLLPNLFLEMGANLSTDTAYLAPIRYNTISMDVNEYLPDGQSNPGYLVPYGQQTRAQFWYQLTQVEEYRSTLAYNLDLTGISKWLGTHTFGLLGEYSRTDFYQDVDVPFNQATVGLAGWSPDAVTGVNILDTRAYFVNGKVPVLPGANYLLQNLAQINSYGTMEGAGAAEDGPLNIALFPEIANENSRTVIQSISYAEQDKWLSGHLVTLFGLRRDRTESYATSGAEGLVDPEVAGSSPTNTVADYYSTATSLPFLPSPMAEAQGWSRTYGAVLHTWPWLDLTYNQSDNFEPVGNSSWVNFLGEPAPNSIGKTQDYGFRLYFLDNRLSLGLSRFSNSATNQAEGATSYSAPIKDILDELRTNFQDNGDPGFTGMATQYPAETSVVSDTFSYNDGGYELTAVYNPIPNWRIMLTGSINDNLEGAHLESFEAYLNSTNLPYQGLATWQSYVNGLNQIATGTASPLFTSLNPNSAADRTTAASVATYISGEITTLENTEIAQNALNGVETDRDGKYALNGVSTYTFDRGFMRNVSIGANFRWRSADEAGYVPIYTNGEPTANPNVSEPIYGSPYLDVGALLGYDYAFFHKKIRMHLQLNVDNLFNDTATQVVNVATDTDGVDGATNALVGVDYRVRPPRNYTFSARYDY